MKKIFVHVGYPKTATTTLQKNLFARHSDLSNLRINLKQDEWQYGVLYLPVVAFKRHLDKFISSLSRQIASQSKILIHSNESYTGKSMLFIEKPTPFVWTLDSTSIARKMQLLFSRTNLEPQILVTIRKQVDLLPSLYAQVYNLCFSHYRETKNFDDYLDYCLNQNEDNFTLNMLFYADIIGEYAAIFGKEKVNVLIFEKLKTNAAQFIEELSSRLEIDTQEAKNLVLGKHDNKKAFGEKYKTDSRSLGVYLKRFIKKRFGDNLINPSTPLTRGLMRWLNRISIGGGFDADITMTKDQKNEIATLYRANNIELAEEYNLDLKKYGYF